MKFLLAFAVGATAANLPTLSEAVADIPSCAFDALKNALKSEECDVNNVNSDLFRCWCAHTSGIGNYMTDKVDTQCLLDFADAYGRACAAYGIDGTTASDWPKATSELASELGVKATGGSGSATTTGAADATEKADSGDATSSSSGDAAAPTPMPKVLGWVGGAAAAIVPMIL